MLAVLVAGDCAAAFVAFICCFIVYITHRKGATTPETATLRGDKSSQQLCVDVDEERCIHPPPDLEIYKEMYFKLHNLENHFEILPKARDLLIAMLSEALEATCSQGTPFLSLKDYDPEQLQRISLQYLGEVTSEWEGYLQNRRNGGRRVMFQDVEQAKLWLIKSAPVKYVDGAWLGHLNKSTTAFANRPTTKDAWQILSEELGDGELEKNHVYIYKELMREIGSELPDPTSEQFIKWPDFADVVIWKAAVKQLLISLFPNEFLPEILGFNMHFEMLTLETLIAAKELKELRLNPYYFTLHICIDNADTGHTAIATNAITKYINLVRETDGELASQLAWKRVQAGFALSEYYVSHTPTARYTAQPITESVSSIWESEVMRIFRTKSGPSTGKLHCNCPIKIGGRSLSSWLDQNALNSDESCKDFLRHLSNARSLIYKGDHSKSRFVSLLSWNGGMFGSFTQEEVRGIKKWIDSLEPPKDQVYWLFTGRREEASSNQFWEWDRFVHISMSKPCFEYQTWRTGSIPRLSVYTPTRRWSRLFALWFTHPSLLESFITIPWNSASKMGCAILRILRAQHGFNPEGPDVAGMDEVNRPSSTGLIEIGLEMVKTCGQPEPRHLKDVLAQWSSDFAAIMLQLSIRPRANLGMLLGVALAFAEFHKAFPFPCLISPATRDILSLIGERELRNFESCIPEIKAESSQRYGFYRGYESGKREISLCIQESND